MKLQRQRALVDLVRRKPLPTQHEIRAELALGGHEATQSTISRDLEELGLVRLRDAGGKLRYALPTEAATARVAERLRTLIAEFVISVEPAENLAVARTTPGAANAVAEAIDHAAVEGILGTLAGDDTILLVGGPGVKGRSIAARIRELGGLT